MKKDCIETPVAAEMRELAATLLGVRGSNWRKEVGACAPPWLPGSMGDERFKEMPGSYAASDTRR